MILARSRSLLLRSAAGLAAVACVIGLHASGTRPNATQRQAGAPTEPAPASLKGLTHARLVELNSSPRNGNSDIFWVDVRVIHELRTAARR